MAITTDTYTTPGADAWVCPGGVTEVVVEVWGGGGGGGAGASDAYYGGSGGGGGGYSKKTLAVTPATSYDYTVGAAGTGGSGSGDGGAGGASWFKSTGDVLAAGGAGGSFGSASRPGGAGGAAASGKGDVRYSGGAGAANSTMDGTGGGGSAGTGSDGNTGSYTTGAVAVAGGGPGGNGSSSGVGSPPASGPGGGGGGGDDSSKAGGAGYAGKVAITYDVPEPETPDISAPTSAYAAAPGISIDLTASAVCLTGQVKYRWKYSLDGGADQDIGDSDLGDSGEAKTYSWDTDGLSVGTYLLKCWAVSALDLVSDDYDSVEITLANVVIVAPADEASFVAGEIDLTAKGYFDAAGSLRIQWEVDTNTPPDDESDDYDLITSALTDQGEEVTVTATLPDKGAWYVRARAVDEEDAASDWTEILTVYILEELRLIAGSQVQQSILTAVNKVYCKVKDTATVETATNNTAGDPLRYELTPRETAVLIPDGDSTAAQAVATQNLNLRKSERVYYSGLRVRLMDGMKLERGQQVGVSIERLGISTTLPIRELVFDVANDICEVSVGEFHEPRTDMDMLLALAQKLQSLEKESA